MAAAKRQQSNVMLYTIITFVGLFIVATAVAVIYYVNAEKYRTTNADLERQMDELATRQERQKIGAIVGAKQPRKSRLGSMNDYLDKMVSLVIGGPLEETSAEVKVGNVDREIVNVLEQAQKHIGVGNIDPNTTGLTSIIEALQEKLDHTISERANIEKQLLQLQQRFDDTMTVSLEKEQTLLAEKEKYHQQVVDITEKYDELKLLMEQTSEQQAQTLRAQLEEERDKAANLKWELLKTREELKMAQDRMKGALERLQQIKPLPEREVTAYQPDGKVILIDEQAGIVHLSIGIDDHVYQGLTFSVYDRHTPIPEDGKGKAEVEVFGVAKNFSTARIINSQKKNPIALEDNVANLIWDPDKTSVFVVVGEFDIDGDERIDYDGIERVKALIEDWGGAVADEISIDTDYLVLGSQPRVPPKPTFEDLERDPMANRKYDAAQQRLNNYMEVQDRAQTLWIPIFSYERFLYFIGYKGNIGSPGAF